MGYDVHKLTKERDLIIGGVKIPYEKGLLGHSDADNGASNLQRCRAAGYLTLAAVAKCAYKHDHLARCSRE